jgi:hypothetical protein
MINLNKSYLFFLALTFLIPILDFFYYLKNIDLVSIGKYPFFILFVISIIYHFKNRIYLTFSSVLFLLSLLFSVMLSFYYQNSISSATFSHIYAFLMPVFSISFGYHFYAAYRESKQLQLFFSKIMYISFWVSICLTLGYIYFYYITKEWGYFGFGTGLPLIFGYILSKNPKIAFFSFFLNIFSGKRTGIIVTIVQYIRILKFKFFLQTPIAATFSICVLIFLVQIMNKYDIFQRFELILDFDSSDAYMIFISTGGRLTEIISLFNYWTMNPEKLVFGSALGAKFLFVDPRGEFPNELMHYSHFSPTFYVFLIGLPLTLLLYISILKQLKYISSLEPLTLIFLSFFVSSFFGSIMFVDPRFWFFFGCLLGYKKLKSKQYV